jgi:hypothetical protein
MLFVLCKVYQSCSVFLSFFLSFVEQTRPSSASSSLGPLASLSKNSNPNKTNFPFRDGGNEDDLGFGPFIFDFDCHLIILHFSSTLPSPAAVSLSSPIFL